MNAYIQFHFLFENCNIFVYPCNILFGRNLNMFFFKCLIKNIYSLDDPAFSTPGKGRFFLSSMPWVLFAAVFLILKVLFLLKYRFQRPDFQPITEII